MSRRSKGRWASVGALFLIGILCRSPILARQPEEGDELIYRALVEQLEEGRGFTLQGHPILQQPWIVRSEYDVPLFIHPPGGIALFWLLHRLFGEHGWGLAQLLSFSVFYWAMLLLASQVIAPYEAAGYLFVAFLSAFTPIMTHVTSRFWLEGPILASSTAGAALFLLGLNRRRVVWVILAGLALGYASLVKMTALLVLPGLIALGWATSPEEATRSRFRLSLLLVFVVGSIELWWQAWNWEVTGTPFPARFGRPAPELVASNPYVHYITVIRSPWIYLRLLPTVLSTFVPAVALLVAQWSDAPLRHKGLALLFWVATITGVHVALGAIGYAKLLRYIVLVTPATVLFFGLVSANAWHAISAGETLRMRTRVTGVLFVAAMAGLTLEIIQGIRTPFSSADLIIPLW